MNDEAWSQCQGEDAEAEADCEGLAKQLKTALEQRELKQTQALIGGLKAFSSRGQKSSPEEQIKLNKIQK
jgi:hypothetical protein